MQVKFTRPSKHCQVVNKLPVHFFNQHKAVWKSILLNRHINNLWTNDRYTPLISFSHLLLKWYYARFSLSNWDSQLEYLMCIINNLRTKGRYTSFIRFSHIHLKWYYRFFLCWIELKQKRINMSIYCPVMSRNYPYYKIVSVCRMNESALKVN